MLGVVLVAVIVRSANDRSLLMTGRRSRWPRVDGVGTFQEWPSWRTVIRRGSPQDGGSRVHEGGGSG
jgi:hypothetical protein